MPLTKFQLIKIDSSRAFVSDLPCLLGSSDPFCYATSSFLSEEVLSLRGNCFKRLDSIFFDLCPKSFFENRLSSDMVLRHLAQDGGFFSINNLLCIKWQEKKFRVFRRKDSHLETLLLNYEDMSLLVQKYGGSSLATSEKITAVADRIAGTYRRGFSLIVVVSAMGDTTDALIAQAEEVSQNPCPREMDMLLSVGERVSMALLSMALKDRKIPAISFTGSQSGILTDDHHGKAKIHRILGDRIRASLEKKQIAIVAGFQGMSLSREITTLGRGGSDTSAVALASAFHAEVCEIFTDVEGVFAADP
jgi:uridylate kinase